MHLLMSAITDYLTNMNNRLSFYDYAQVIADQSIRYQQPFSIIMIDIDFFKDINDK